MAKAKSKQSTKVEEIEDVNDIKVRVKKAWKALNRYGIYTEEQLDEALKNMEPINIACMVTPINNFKRD